MNDTQKHAYGILNAYFSLNRAALGAERLDDACRRDGWTLFDHARLVRFLADGCHNLPEIAAGLWEGGQAVPEDRLRIGLEQECRALYKLTEVAQYPATWEREQAIFAWRTFCERVAAALDLPPQYGRPFSKPETAEQARARIVIEADSRAITTSPPLWARLLGVRGRLIPDQAQH